MVVKITLMNDFAPRNILNATENPNNIPLTQNNIHRANCAKDNSTVDMNNIFAWQLNEMI